MKYQEMKDLIDREIIPQVLQIRDAGQKEYARNKDNVFANFERVSKLLSISREKALMTYLLKHIDGIISYVDGHDSQREDVTGRITDAIVYLMLFWAMTKNSDKSNISVTEFKGYQNDKYEKKY